MRLKPPGIPLINALGNNEHAFIKNVVALSRKDDSVTYIQGSDKVKNKVKMVSQWGNISIFCCVQ